MHVGCPQGKLSWASHDEGRVATQPYAFEGHQGNSYTTECKGSAWFLALASYYRWYEIGFAAIISPLHALTKKEVVFHWTPECHEAFTKLKHLLTTAPITAFPDFSLPFRLYINASTLGSILAQVQDRKERIICCNS